MTIRIACNMQVANGAFKDSFTPPTLEVAQASNDYFALVLTVPVEEEELDFLDMDQLGWAMFKNLDDTNFVSLGVVNPITGSVGAYLPFAKLKPGEHIIIRLDNSASYCAWADTDPVDLEIRVYGD